MDYEPGDALCKGTYKILATISVMLVGDQNGLGLKEIVCVETN
jgi:hypothetical protein